MKHRVEVVLVATLPKPRCPTDTRFLLLTQPDDQWCLPWCELPEEKTTLECAADLLSHTTGLLPKLILSGWLQFHPCPLFDAPGRVRQTVDGTTERVIAVPYGVMIPAEKDEIIPMVVADWLTYQEILELRPLYMDHLEILTAAANTM